MGRTAWAVIVARVWWTRKINPRHIGLWKRRWVEKSKNRLFHPAWESRKERGIPTFPQPRRLLVKHKPDRSCATKTGHFNLLRTEYFSEYFSEPLEIFSGRLFMSTQPLSPLIGDLQHQIAINEQVVEFAYSLMSERDAHRKDLVFLAISHKCMLSSGAIRILCNEGRVDDALCLTRV